MSVCLCGHFRDYDRICQHNDTGCRDADGTPASAVISPKNQEKFHPLTGGCGTAGLYLLDEQAFLGLKNLET